MNQQEQNTASTKAFILECIDREINRAGGFAWNSMLHFQRLKELKIRRAEVVEMLKEVDE